MKSIQTYKTRRKINKIDERYPTCTVASKLFSFDDTGYEASFNLTMGILFLGFFLFPTLFIGLGGALLSSLLGGMAFAIMGAIYSVGLIHEIARAVDHFNFRKKRIEIAYNEPLRIALRMAKSESGYHYYPQSFSEKLHDLSHADLDIQTRKLVEQSILDITKKISSFNKLEQMISKLEPLRQTEAWKTLYLPAHEDLGKQRAILAQEISTIYETLENVWQAQKELTRKAEKKRKEEKERLQAEAVLVKSQLAHKKIAGQNFLDGPSAAANKLSERLKAIEHVDSMLKK